MVCKKCKITMHSGTHYEINKDKRIMKRYDECPKCHFRMESKQNNNQEK